MLCRDGVHEREPQAVARLRARLVEPREALEHALAVRYRHARARVGDADPREVFGALERELQTQLFERRTRAIALTEHGAKLFAEVEPLLLELDRVTLRFMACVSGSSAEPRAAQTTRERHAFRVA